ncbi:hypothetical protein DSBG_1048 [Desulfosporosinus sp. BG]|nr:hypothetical protein DSBG_1048 [Desulfosporosinus sp. BG]
MFVQTEWDRGIFRLWTKGSAFCIYLKVFTDNIRERKG